jgi:hypothetical protein
MSEGRPDCTHACLTSLARYAGTPAPSHQRKPWTARRRSGGVVITTYAAATPAEKRTTFATARAAERVMGDQLRRELEPGEVVPVPLYEEPLDPEDSVLEPVVSEP